MQDSSVRVRIAPSPTGDPHVGTAYIGQINEVFARSLGGKMVLRIEDTDQTRSAKVYEDGILNSLKWFGLQWDEGPDVGGEYGPYRQSERKDLYDQYSQQLMKTGGAYRCFCSAERLTELRAEQRAKKENPRYDGHCRGLSEADVAEKVAEGLPFVIRLAMPTEGETVVQDRLRGDITFQNALIDDQVLIKSDGMPTYHFANVVDDHLMEISHVIRAEEWINSTPKHLVLYKAFGWEHPEFIHMPLLRNEDKSKISKRKNPTSLSYYEKAGYVPGAMRNFLALMGWTHPEEKDQFTIDEMIKVFKIEDMSLGGPVFDLKKLRWLNGLYIRDMDSAQLEKNLYEITLNQSYLRQILPIVQTRMEAFEDFWSVADFFFAGEVNPDYQKVIPKKRKPSETRKCLLSLMERLEYDAQSGWTAEIIEEAMRKHCEKTGWSTKELFMAVRLIVTGKAKTPPLTESMEVLGKERVRRRFQQANEKLKTIK